MLADAAERLRVLCTLNCENERQKYDFGAVVERAAYLGDARLIICDPGGWGERVIWDGVGRVDAAAGAANGCPSNRPRTAAATSRACPALPAPAQPRAACAPRWRSTWLPTTCSWF